MNLKKEKYYSQKNYQIIIGLDEAGRGSLAGPVSAAAVIVNPKIYSLKTSKGKSNQQKNKIFQEILKRTNDSKKLTPKEREFVFKLIKKSPDIKFSYSFIQPQTIDKININQAIQKAMLNCLKKILTPKIKNKRILILIDGNQPLILNDIFFKNKNIIQKTIIKGDGKIFSIALASIIAKVNRDQTMKNLSLKYPRYNFAKHKGYGTQEHCHLLKKYGFCKIHRQSFKLKS